MDRVFLGWAAFRLISGLLPIIVAGYRLRQAKWFRMLNRGILIAGSDKLACR